MGNPVLKGLPELLFWMARYFGECHFWSRNFRKTRTFSFPNQWLRLQAKLSLLGLGKNKELCSEVCPTSNVWLLSAVFGLAESLHFSFLWFDSLPLHPRGHVKNKIFAYSPASIQDLKYGTRTTLRIGYEEFHKKVAYLNGHNWSVFQTIWRHYNRF